MRRYPVVNLGQSDASVWSKPISDDQRPAEIPAECKFLGYLYDVAPPNTSLTAVNAEVKTNLVLAQQAGYTDIKYSADTAVGQLRPQARKMVWACLSKGAEAPPTGPQSKYDQPQQAQATAPATQPLPEAPAKKIDLLPVAVGTGVVAIFVAVISGAFGK